MDIIRLEKGNAPAWAYKAYDYVRTDAFVCGQGIPLETEFSHDGSKEDLNAIVLVDDHKPVAGCRITYPEAGTAQIGRVCVVRKRQKSGIGGQLIAAAEQWIAENGSTRIIISSQDRALGFYEKCGYHLVPTEAQEEEQPNRFGFRCVWVEKELSGEEQ